MSARRPTRVSNPTFESRAPRRFEGTLFADAMIMRKARKKQSPAVSSNSRENLQEPRETVTALADGPSETAPQSVGDTTAAVPDRDRIAMRAYELYLARGAGEGSAFDDWLAAEREVMTTDPDRGSD
jgi:hypothetical protein